MLLGVNIDHIAVLREARQVNDPDILMGMYAAIIGGADQITTHLREDRRHINENDVKDIINHSRVPVNLECSINEEIIDFVCKFRPHRATLVPEKREELTTEGGLNLSTAGLENVINRLKNEGIKVSLFIDTSRENIDIASELAVDCIELHTGTYANIFNMLNSNIALTKYSIKNYEKSREDLQNLLKDELANIKHLAAYAKGLGLKVAAGHGLNYQNVVSLTKNSEIFELNIGQSIIARAIFVGMKTAVYEMKELIK